MAGFFCFNGFQSNPRMAIADRAQQTADLPMLQRIAFRTSCVGANTKLHIAIVAFYPFLRVCFGTAWGRT